MEQGKNIVLCGFMGSGKTSVGRRVAKQAGRRFIDMDRLIEQEMGMTVSDIFEQCGEAGFRRLEARTAYRLSQENGLVIATGGGTLLDPQNAEMLRSSGIIVLLDTPLPAIRERLKNDTTRPLLQRPDKEAEMERLYRERIPIYRAASDFSVPAGRPVRAVAEAILRLALEKNSGSPLGKKVRVVVDRPMGSCHPKHGFSYPVNYGYVPGVSGGDGEDQDAYILGVRCPVKAFTGVVAAVIRRRDDDEDKWVVLPSGYRCSRDEIENETQFQEQFFDSFYEFSDDF